MSLEETKKEKFLRDPDSFIDIDDLVIAVKRVGTELVPYISSTNRNELREAHSLVLYECFNIYNKMQHSKDNNKKIIEIENDTIENTRKDFFGR